MDEVYKILHKNKTYQNPNYQHRPNRINLLCLLSSGFLTTSFSSATREHPHPHRHHLHPQHVVHHQQQQHQQHDGTIQTGGPSGGAGNAGVNAQPGGSEDFRCDPCNKNLSSLTRLKRHIQNVHMRPTKEPVCNICKRVYSSLNSLRNHKSIYHRNVKPPKEEGAQSLASSANPFFSLSNRSSSL